MKRVASVQDILRRWDPIGIRPGEFGPADEYDDYAPQIVSMVARGCTREALCDHLGKLRTRTIGVEADPGHDATIAGAILETLARAEA